MITRVDSFFAPAKWKMLVFFKPLSADPKYGESITVQASKEASKKLKNAANNALSQKLDFLSGDVFGTYQFSLGNLAGLDLETLGVFMGDCSQAGEQPNVALEDDISSESSQFDISCRIAREKYIFLYDNNSEDYNALKEHIRSHKGLSRTERKLLIDKIDLIVRRDLYGTSSADLFDDDFNEETGGLV